MSQAYFVVPLRQQGQRRAHHYKQTEDRERGDEAQATK